MPNLGLVNKESLDKFLKSKVFIHSNGQLRAAHLILGYTTIFKSFPAPKCVIKANDPRLHWISVVVPGFLLPSPKPEGVQAVTPIFKGIPKVEVSSSYSVIEEGKEEKEEEREKIVKVSNSKDDFDVFDQALSSNALAFDLGHSFTLVPDKMRIQQKPRSSLLDLIKSQLGRDAPRKATQKKPPTPLPTLPS